MDVPTKQRTAVLVLTIILAFTLVHWVDAHGRLFDPPSRSTAWRVGFDTPKDFNDMEGFCGGFERQWLVNGGKCGVCGDPFDEAIKPHEAPGGVFATGTIVRRYIEGQIIPVTIQITATHRGYYEFKLCPNNNPTKDPTQDCFEKFPLIFVDSAQGTSQFSLENLLPATYQVRLQLPPGITCTQCIIQWTYVTGNRWGVCPDGSGKLGCGPQESFRACSDVSISSKNGVPVIATPTPTQPTTTTSSPLTTTTTIRTTTTLLPSPLPFTPRPTTVIPTRPSRPTRPRPTKATKRPFELLPSWKPTKRPVRPTLPTIPPLTVRPTTEPSTTTTTTTSTSAPVISAPDGPCTTYTGVGVNNMPGMSVWCTNNCNQGYCPSSFCACAD